MLLREHQLVVAVMAMITYATCEYVETRTARWAFRARTD